MMRGVCRSMARGALALGVFLISVPVASRPPREWVVASIAPEGSPSQRLCDGLLEAVRRGAGVPLRFKRRYSAVLGDEISTIRALQEDRIQAFCGSLGAVTPVVPEVGYLELPYLFRSFDHYRGFLRRWQRGFAPEVRKLFESRGVVYGGIDFLGWRNLASTRKPLRRPADLARVAVRSQPAALHLAWWNALGALPKATALTEVNSAIDLGLVEALDVPITFLYATSVDAKLRHYTLSRHMIQSGLFLLSARAWSELPGGRRQAIETELDSALVGGGAEHRQFDDELVEALRSRGVAVVELSPADRAEFERVGATVQAKVHAEATGDARRFLDHVLQAARGN